MGNLLEVVDGGWWVVDASVGGGWWMVDGEKGALCFLHHSPPTIHHPPIHHPPPTIHHPPPRGRSVRGDQPAQVQPEQLAFGRSRIGSRIIRHGQNQRSSLVTAAEFGPGIEVL